MCEPVCKPRRRSGTDGLPRRQSTTIGRAADKPAGASERAGHRLEAVMSRLRTLDDRRYLADADYRRLRRHVADQRLLGLASRRLLLCCRVESCAAFQPRSSVGPRSAS